MRATRLLRKAIGVAIVVAGTVRIRGVLVRPCGMLRKTVGIIEGRTVGSLDGSTMCGGFWFRSTVRGSAFSSPREMFGSHRVMGMSLDDIESNARNSVSR